MGQQTKFIFVVGGVLSGIGKGITAASLANIMQARGLKVNMQKCDPYMNVDAGTLNPGEHGECFVTKDGAETDLDLGHYERFLDTELTASSSVMSGQIWQSVINRERDGEFLGRTVQVVPHITAAMKQSILKAATGYDLHFVEVGGTVGDIEGQAWIEAIRELGLQIGLENCLYVHLSYLPYLGTSKEFKTKPAQNAVRDLRNVGIVPNILIVRSESPAPSAIKEKLSLFSGVPVTAIGLLPNAESIYEIPLSLERQGIGEVVAQRFGFTNKPQLGQWQDMVDRVKKTYKKCVQVAVVAKYLTNEDTYFSVLEALKAAAWQNDVCLTIKWIDAEKVNQHNIAKWLTGIDGVLVPGGFGSRGVEGMIVAAGYCLDNKVPYLGLCLGLQVAVIAAARRAGLERANSEEFVESKYNVIYLMNEQSGKQGTGGTMRLGDYTAKLSPESRTKKLYKTKTVTERHRHRYEVNQAYRQQIEQGGLVISGTSVDGKLVEFVEATPNPTSDHFMVATQAHPEFSSRPTKAHPLFSGFVLALKKTF